MLTLKDLAAVKVAVEICNNDQLKKEILCIPGLDYEANKTGKMGVNERKRLWDELLEKKAGTILKNLFLTEELQEKVIGAVFLVGMRILSWAEYHKRTLLLTRNYCFNFLNKSFFTERGIVDCKKAAEELMNDTSLSIKQKYKLALLYCMNEHIPALYNKMAEKDKVEFFDAENPSSIKQPHFVKFWSYYLKEEADKLRGDTDLNLYWLQMAVKSGSKDVVEYCLHKTNLITDDGALIHAALQAVRYKIKGKTDWTIFSDDGSDEVWIGDHWNDDGRIDDWREPWVPNHYYIDVMCLLFSKMNKDTRIAFLKEDIKGIGYENDPVDNRSRILEFFLDWPYQDYFLKTASLMWEFLPETNFFDLSDLFSLKINTKPGCFKYGEDKIYDYRELFIEFLTIIPESNKKIIFKDCNFDIGDGRVGKLNAGILIIFNLLPQINYTNQNKIIIEMVLNCATNEDKRKFISSKEGIIVCILLMKERRWTVLDEFVSSCHSSKTKATKFKKMLCFQECAKEVCIDLITNNESKAFESFVRWSSLSDEEIDQLKKQMILSEHGRNACLKIISSDKKLKALNEFICSCLQSNEEIIALKQELLFCPNGMQKCVELLTADQVELANEFTKWGLSSEDLLSEEIVQYKKNVANEIGRKVCEKLISYVPVNHLSNDYGFNHLFNYCPMIQFNDGGKWEDVEKFLTWCFSTEDEIKDFKKSLTKKKNGDGTSKHLIRTHLNLMRANKWEEAEKLFGWLGLSVKKIRKLKKETILSRRCLMWIDMSVQDTHPSNFLDSFGGKWENIDLFLRWCLKNEDDVLEFRNTFDKKFGFKRYEDDGENIPNDTRNNLNQFYFFIKEFLNDFNQKSD